MKNENKIRCSWCEKDDLYRNYHDTEWGRPSFDDDYLFEILLLETFQAGLSWYTVLAKRENFRLAFDNFNCLEISKYKSEKIELLIKDAGIIRHHLKIKAAIENAQQFIAIQAEFGSFANYIWQFVDKKPIDNAPQNTADLPAKSILSELISKDLKSRNFQFVGATVIYSFLQAVGIINDHVADCWVRNG